MNNHTVCSHSTRTDLLLMTMIWTLTPSKNQTCRWNPDHSCTGLNDQARKGQRQSSKNSTQDSDKHSVIWRNVFVFNDASIYIHGEGNFTFHQKYRKYLTMKQMLNISEKLISEQSDKIYGVKTINWEVSSWKHLSLIGDEEVVSLSHAKVYVFSDSVLCFGKMSENPQSNIVWEDKLTWFQSSPVYRTLDKIDGEPTEFEWNISQDSPHCSFATKSRSHCQD